MNGGEGWEEVVGGSRVDGGREGIEGRKEEKEEEEEKGLEERKNARATC